MLSEELLGGRMQAGDTIVIDIEDDKFVTRVKVEEVVIPSS